MREIAERGEAPQAFRVEESSPVSGAAEGLCQRGIAAWKAGRPAEALALFDQAAAMEPGNAMAWNNRGAALQGSNRPDEALASYDKALAREPDYVEALYNRANVLSHLKRFAEALADYDGALARQPDHAQAWKDRGTTLWDMNRIEEALASYDRALALNPGYADAWYKRGNMLWTAKRDISGAIRDLEQAVRANPEHAYAQGDLLHMRMQCADWRDFERQVALIDDGVRAGKPIAQPFVYLAISDSPARLQACSIIFSDHQYPAAPALWTGGKRAHGKIRVGYVSGEFREQATAYLTAGLYERHDKSRFEIIAFDNGRSDQGPTRKRLEAAWDQCVDIAGLPDRVAAEKILGCGIDILVNLNGYFGKHRMGVFAQRPAPIQVNYLGFPATLGARYMDYILADRVVVPESERGFYSEKLVWLPGSYQVNDSRRPIAQTAPARAACGLPEASFVFCNFNQSYKLTPDAFAAWMRILKSVEGSVLWLLENNACFPENLRREAIRHGVAGERLVFAPMVPVADHLARLRLADLFLDSLPYTAHTTASDALWAAVPLLTCRGYSFAGRVAASLLQAVGLPELVTDTMADYESVAVRLTRDAPALRLLRQKLATNRSTAPLFDTDRFRRHIEAAYTGMWNILQRGEKPQSFDVAPDNLRD